MQLIQEGKPRGEKFLAQVTCRYCEAIFRFPRTEGTLVNDDKDGDYVKIKCPACKGHNYVSLRSFNIPPEMVEKKEDKK